MNRYICDDGNAPIEIEAESPESAAQEYVDGGDWGESTETSWVAVWVTPLDQDGEEIEDERESCTVAVNPELPDCDGDRAHADCEPDEGSHDWHAPLVVVGGIKENPGVYGHGGGVTITEVCANCGLYRTIDTWAQDPATGRQGLRSVGYGEPDERSLAWVAKQRPQEPEVQWETAESMMPGHGLIVGTASDGRSCLYVVDEDGNCEIDDHETDGDFDGEGWPWPPQNLIDEARGLAVGSAVLDR